MVTFNGQRKLRKGTHSCWECKRRKARCAFSPSDDSVCVGCRRRGTKCLDQNESDIEPESREARTNSRLDRIESMLETLLHQQESTRKSMTSISETPSATDEESEKLSEDKMTTSRKRRLSEYPSLAAAREFSHRRQSCLSRTLGGTLSKTLHNLLPTPDECRVICSSAKFLPCFFQQMLTRDWKTISASASSLILTSNKVAEIPHSDVHPILLAQKMLMLVCLAQFISRELHLEGWDERSEHMAAVAIDVVAREEFCGNAEGLECLMLEATYHASNGDIRRAFLAVRRAIAIGQLLGIHRVQQPIVLQLDTTASPFDSSYMWHRIVSADRLFSLILGVPQGYSCAQVTQYFPLDDLDPERHLERRHSEISSWILDRNERGLDDFISTHTIDQALTDAASVLPPAWWLLPRPSQTTSRRDMFLTAARLNHQILHFNLVNQTHMPYLHHPGVLCGYNKLACATASREILQRYLILQESSVVAHTSHVIEFFSLVGAMTLTLAHLERHWQDDSQELTILAHTRSSDRALVEQTALHMTRIPNCKGPQILRHLLQVEDEAFHTKSVGSGAIVKGVTEQGQFFELKIPYFGQLKLDSAHISLSKEADIEDISVSVRNADEVEQVEQISVLNDFNFDLTA